jgi:DHA2 family methylenomycin A resistance protein-like MFS transporter
MRSTKAKCPRAHDKQQPPKSGQAGNSDAPALAKRLTLAAMSLGYGVVQLDVTIVNTALSSIGASLGGGVTERQWVVSAYTIAFAALILTTGALGDRIGAKKVFMAGFAIFTGASLACALAPTAATLIAARAVQGVGAAILVPNSLALLNHVYPAEKERGRAVGIWAAGASLALTAGPLAGLAAFAVLAALFFFQERRTRQPMLPLSLFNHRMFALTSVVGLLVNVAFYGLIFVLSLYFQQINGLSPFATGLAFLPMMGAVLPMNLLAARAAERFGAPAIIAAGAAIAGAGCAALIGIHHGTSYWALCAQLVAIGAGLGLLVPPPPMTSTLLGSVEKTRSGIAAGVLNATRQTGSVLGVALFGSLVGQKDAFVLGARESLIISAVLLLGAAATIVIGGRKQETAMRPASRRGE